MKNKFSKLMSILITVTMLLGIVLPAWTVSAAASLGQITADDEVSIVPPADDYSYVNFAAEIDETAEFTDDSVIIFMKRSETEVNKVYTAEDFPELDVAYIEDLTYLTNEELLNDPEFMANYTQILQIHLNTDTEAEVVEAVEALNDRSTVDLASVTPNYVMEMESTSAFTPGNETYYSSQEGYFTRINLQAAWNLLPDDISTVKVGVIDTGITTHPDFDNNLVDGYDSYTDTVISKTSPNVIYNPTNIYDHATYVAGMIGAEDNEEGVIGIVPKVQIVPLRVSEYDSSRNSQVIDESSFARLVSYMNNNNIPVANYSAYPSFDSAATLASYESIINNYFGLLVISAGNNNSEIKPANGYDLVQANCNNIISVMGTAVLNNNEIRYTSSGLSSNYSSEYVDIAAPWFSYTTTYLRSNGTYNYGIFDGTSASAPYVTGVAALIKSVCPKISTNDLKTAILEGADQRNSLNSCCIGGRFLDAKGALDYAIDNYEFLPAKTFMEDINNDGCDDLVYYREYNGQRHFQTFFGSNSYYLGNPSTDDDTMTSYNTFKDDFNENDLAYLGDVDGDGLKDIIIHSTNTSGKRVLTVYKGNSNKRFDSGIVTTTTNTHNTATYPCAMFVGDFDGDQRDDFLVHYRDTNGTRTNLLYCAKGPTDTDSTNGLFKDPIRTYSSRTYVDPSTDPIFISDTDGNGCDDIVIHWSANNKRQLLVYPGSVNGKFNSTDGVNAKNVNTNTNDNSDTGVYPCTLHMGDFNGDGKGDFLVHYKTLSNKRANFVFCGNSSYMFDNGVNTTFTETYSDADKVYIGEVTGNDTSGKRKDDVIVVSVSNGIRQLTTYRSSLSGDATFAAGVSVSTGQTHDNTMSVRMMIGDVNGSGHDDFITEVATADTAYRSEAYINLGTSTGLQGYSRLCKLRTYFYIDYTLN